MFGLSWADPIAALVIAAVALREGREALKGDSCCTPVAVLLAHPDAETDAGCGCSDSKDGDGGCNDGCCAPAAVDVADVRLGRS